MFDDYDGVFFKLDVLILELSLYFRRTSSAHTSGRILIVNLPSYSCVVTTMYGLKNKEVTNKLDNTILEFFLILVKTAEVVFQNKNLKFVFAFI